MSESYGVFGVTDFIEHGFEGEVRHGEALVDAAKEARVKHFVYSTFDHTELGDGIPVPHFESKWTVDGNRFKFFSDTRIPASIRRPVDSLVHRNIH